MNILSLEHVSKSFDSFYAVKDLSLEVKQGQTYGLLGPNGAGKTTTIRMIMGIILPDEGDVHIFGQANSLEVLSQVGYLPEERGLYRKMKVNDVLYFFGELKGMNKNSLTENIDYWTERFDLTDWLNKKVEDLSRGMQQKLQFIATILHEPRLIILDEPFTGLDPVNTTLVKDIILEFRDQGVTVILSTHLMEQVEKLCDSICLVDRGQSVLKGKLSEIKQQYGHNQIQLQYSGDSSFLKDEELVEKYDDYGNYVELRLKEGANPQQLLHRALNQAEVHRFEMVEPSLNQLFIETVESRKENASKEFSQKVECSGSGEPERA